jgi:UDP-GlcNAc:undecaprenyl-phosphate GlcNAc-1-phosphate transferase
MSVDSQTIIRLLITVVVAFIVTFAATPLVRSFAKKIGAMDIPDKRRRVHDHPIPRLGGLAIFLGFIMSILLFEDMSPQIQGLLLGCLIIVTIGAVDDIVSLSAWVKFAFQIIAALVAIFHGIEINVLMNPFFWMSNEYIVLGWWSAPITLIWIVAITNSVNLIDGLDGLAVGVSAISSVTMLIIALLVTGDPSVSFVLAALSGACIGFMPYNLNPAKIFMGDTGALLLGYVLSTITIMGLFKFYALVSFAVPLLALAVPMLDTVFSFMRRLLRGQSPFRADRGHLHHRLLDLGLSQKQAVAILYCISGILGLVAMLIATSDELRVVILILTFLLCSFLWYYIYRSMHKVDSSDQKAADANENPDEEIAESAGTALTEEENEPD